jgi:hypothetical protein
MLYWDLTASRALAVPSAPLPFGTAPVSNGKGVIGSRRPQVQWYSRICLSEVRDGRLHAFLTMQAHDYAGCENCVQVAVLRIPKRISTLHHSRHEISPVCFYTALFSLEDSALSYALSLSSFFGRHVSYLVYTYRIPLTKSDCVNVEMVHLKTNLFQERQYSDAPPVKLVKSGKYDQATIVTPAPMIEPTTTVDSSTTQTLLQVASNRVEMT